MFSGHKQRIAELEQLVAEYKLRESVLHQQVEMLQQQVGALITSARDERRDLLDRQEEERRELLAHFKKDEPSRMQSLQDDVPEEEIADRMNKSRKFWNRWKEVHGDAGMLNEQGTEG